MNDTLTDQLCAAVAELIAAQPEHPGPACRRFQDSWQASRATENAPSRRLSDDMADAATHVAAKLKSVLPDCPSGKKQDNLPLSRLACGDAERSQKKLKSAPHRPTPRCKQHSGNVCRNKGSLPMYRHSCANCRRMPSLCCRPVTPGQPADLSGTVRTVQPPFPVLGGLRQSRFPRCSGRSAGSVSAASAGTVQSLRRRPGRAYRATAR